MLKMHLKQLTKYIRFAIIRGHLLFRENSREDVYIKTLNGLHQLYVEWFSNHLLSECIFL